MPQVGEPIMGYLCVVDFSLPPFHSGPAIFNFNFYNPDLFWDADGEAFYYTAEHHTDLIVRQKESYDSATPASNSVAVVVLLRLGVITGRDAWRDIADRALKTFYDQMVRNPRSLVEMMQALDMHVRGPNEIVCVTPPGTASLAARAWSEFAPNAIILDVPGGGAQQYREHVPAARDREPVGDAPTVYVCHDGTCELPRNEI